MSRRNFYLAGYFLHFLLITAVSAREFFWVVSQSRTVFPKSANQLWRKAGAISSGILLQDPRVPIPLQQTATAYLHLAGIEAGYGFFAPNITGQCRLVLELRYPDGRSQSEVPAVSSPASGLRIATLLDKIGWPEYDRLREPVIRTFAEAAWREHRDATVVRAVFGVIALPTLVEYEQGARPSTEFLYSYEYEFDPAHVQVMTP